MSNTARVFCASTAVLTFLGGIAGLVATPHPAFLIALFAAALLALPAMFTGRKPTQLDLPRINEQLHRFRNAMLLCFVAASGMYAFVLSERRHAATDMVRRFASLSVALWLAAFVLMFFVAYYRTQRRLALSE